MNPLTHLDWPHLV